MITCCCSHCRNFHFFHQLLSRAACETHSELQLGGTSEHNYLRCEIGDDGREHDSEAFKATEEVMASILSEAERSELYCTVAAVLHLGNVIFKESSAGVATLQAEGGGGVSSFLGGGDDDDRGSSFRGDGKMSWYLVFVPLTIEHMSLGAMVSAEARQVIRSASLPTTLVPNVAPYHTLTNRAAAHRFYFARKR